MDAMNEALLGPSQYPGADKEYASPFYFKGTEPQDEQIERRSSLKRAEVKMHNEPRVLPPRNELRSHLDDEVKADLKKDKEGKLATDTIQLTPEQDSFWQRAFEHFAQNTSEAKAVRSADRALIRKWPDLAQYRRWTDSATTPTAQ